MFSMPKMRPDTVRSVSLDDVAACWDGHVDERLLELADGTDSTYFEVLLPTIQSELQHVSPGARILDAGCGLGFLSEQLARRGHSVLGMDVSPASIAAAQRLFSSPSFERGRVEDVEEGAFDICIANMMLQSTPDFRPAIQAMASACRIGGTVIVTVPHPAFWLQTKWPHYLPEGFDYEQETALTLPFAVRNHAVHKTPILYFHRSLATYLNTMADAGLSLRWVAEPPSHPCGMRTNDLLVVVARRLEQSLA